MKRAKRETRYTAEVSRCPRTGARISSRRAALEQQGADGKANTAGAPTREPLPDVGGVARYELVHCMTHGGSSLVFQASRLDTGARTSIKVALVDQPGAREQLERERQILARIGELGGIQGVPEFLGDGLTTGDFPYVELQLINGRTLSEIMVDRGPIELYDFTSVWLPCVDVVADLHRAGIVHAQIQPETLYVSPDGLAKLVDFAMAVEVGQATAPPETGSTQPPEYMSPEQCDDAPKVDLRSDVYSLGVVMYELLAGHPPFFGARSSLMQQHRSGEAPSLTQVEGVPGALCAIVERCLHKDPEQRFADAHELRTALGEALGMPRRVKATKKAGKKKSGKKAGKKAAKRKAS